MIELKICFLNDPTSKTFENSFVVGADKFLVEMG